MASRPRIPAHIKRQVLLEAGFHCTVCGAECPLEHAHIVPWHKVKQHRARDLICLCANCHERSHKEKWGEKALRVCKEHPWVMRKQARDKHPRMVSVEVTVELTLSEFDSKNQRWLQYGLAQFLGISPEEVHIEPPREGNSVDVTVWLPARSAEALMRAYGENDPRLLERFPELPVSGFKRSFPIPLWRMFQIRNAAASLVYHASCLPFANVVSAAESRFLKPNAHIRLVSDPTLAEGEARHYVQQLQIEEDASLISVTILVPDGTTSTLAARKAARAVFEQLGYVVLFSKAAARRLFAVRDDERVKLVRAFAQDLARSCEIVAQERTFDLRSWMEMMPETFHQTAESLSLGALEFLLRSGRPPIWKVLMGGARRRPSSSKGDRADVVALARQAVEESMQFSLAPLVHAAEVELGEDIMLSPRSGERQATVVYTVEMQAGREHRLRQHIIAYSTLEDAPSLRSIEQNWAALLLEVAHELGHLLLEPTRKRRARIGLEDGATLSKIIELEADWFALCVLQMYGLPVSADE